MPQAWRASADDRTVCIWIRVPLLNAAMTLSSPPQAEQSPLRVGFYTLNQTRCCIRSESTGRVVDVFFAILVAAFRHPLQAAREPHVGASDYPRRLAPYFHFAMTDQLSLCPAFRVR
jgi:hypothetical protein